MIWELARNSCDSPFHAACPTQHLREVQKKTIIEILALVANLGELFAYTVLSQASELGWALTWRTCLNGSTITTQGPALDVKVAAMGPNRLVSSVRPWFVKDSPTVEKAVSCYKVDWLVASLLHVSFHSIQSMLAVREFRAAGEECCERGHGRVCANLWCLMLWRLTCIRTIAAMWPSFGFTMWESSQNWGMGACLGQYDKYNLPNSYPLRKYCLHT